MCVNHKNNYMADCLECIKESTFENYFDKLSYMYPDNAEGKPGEFYGGKLVALKPVNVYSAPYSVAVSSGNVIKTIKPGQTVGNIYSHLIKDGVIWWQLENNTFVKHGTGIYDKNVLENSIAEIKAKEKKELDEAVKKRLESNENPFYNFGKGLDELIPDFSTVKWVLIAILALVVLAFVYRIAFK